jgi:hypothetical protein
MRLPVREETDHAAATPGFFARIDRAPSRLHRGVTFAASNKSEQAAKRPARFRSRQVVSRRVRARQTAKQPDTRP